MKFMLILACFSKESIVQLCLNFVCSIWKRKRCCYAVIAPYCMHVSSTTLLAHQNWVWSVRVITASPIPMNIVTIKENGIKKWTIPDQAFEATYMLYSGPPPLPLPPIFHITTTVIIPMVPAGAMPLVHLPSDCVKQSLVLATMHPHHLCRHTVDQLKLQAHDVQVLKCHDTASR